MAAWVAEFYDVVAWIVLVIALAGLFRVVNDKVVDGGWAGVVFSVLVGVCAWWLTR